MVRRVLLALALGALVTAVFVPAASAARPEHFTEEFDFENFSPAGDLCNFDYLQTAVGRDVVTVFEDRVHVLEQVVVTHTNVDTGYTLTETDAYVFTFSEDFKQVGLFWHLRDDSGKRVVFQAGLIVETEDGLRHTPNINPDFGAVICPALGGEVAPQLPPED